MAFSVELFILKSNIFKGIQVYVQILLQPKGPLQREIRWRDRVFQFLKIHTNVPKLNS